MSLENIYTNHVKRTSINQTGISSGMPVTRERDPNLVKLENDVFSEMSDLIAKQNQVNTEEDQKDSKTVDIVRHVSLEDALKELLNGFESFDDKS